MKKRVDRHLVDDTLGELALRQAGRRVSLRLLCCVAMDRYPSMKRKHHTEAIQIDQVSRRQGAPEKPVKSTRNTSKLKLDSSFVFPQVPALTSSQSTQTPATLSRSRSNADIKILTRQDWHASTCTSVLSDPVVGDRQLQHRFNPPFVPPPPTPKDQSTRQLEGLPSSSTPITAVSAPTKHAKLKLTQPEAEQQQQSAMIRDEEEQKWVDISTENQPPPELNLLSSPANGSFITATASADNPTTPVPTKFSALINLTSPAADIDLFSTPTAKQSTTWGDGNKFARLLQTIQSPSDRVLGEITQFVQSDVAIPGSSSPDISHK